MIGEKDVEIILIIFPMFYSVSGFVTQLENLAKQQGTSVHDSISLLIRKWLQNELNKKVMLSVVKANPPLLGDADLNKLKLQLISSQKPQPKHFRVTLRKSNQKPENPKGIFLGFTTKKVAQTLTMVDWNLFVEVKKKHLVRKSWQAKDREQKAFELAKLADRSVQVW